VLRTLLLGLLLLAGAHPAHASQALSWAAIEGENRLAPLELSLHTLLDASSGPRVDQCEPSRLLLAGSDRSDKETGLWWLSPDEGTLRQIEASTSRPSFLVAVSPDARWATYYQQAPQPGSDRFVTDTWVIDLATDERIRLVEGNGPLGWTADGGAVVLRERPSLMARVPGGELVAAENVATGDAMHAANSADGRFRAEALRSFQGAPAGIEIFDMATGEQVLNMRTTRAAITLAWSPDSQRLAFTSGEDGPDGLLWRLQMVDIASRRVSLVDSTRDMQVFSVLWAPALPGCA